ncbi:MAG: hypothetical protein HYV07_14155 [Deltaproteobacteria bacterium]|nr:hypothetical protein [Deltaproteobacteria bacterium]
MVLCSKCGTRFRAYGSSEFEESESTQDGESRARLGSARRRIDPLPSSTSEELRPQSIQEEDSGQVPERMALGVVLPTFDAADGGATVSLEPEEKAKPAAPTKRVVTPKAKGPKDLYERIEAGIDVSPKKRSSQPGSVQVVVSRIPVAARVFVVVFAVALLAGAIWNASRPSERAPSIPPEDASVVPVVTSSTVAEPSPPPAAPVKRTAFSEAPDGFLYVVEDGVAVRSAIGDRSLDVATLRVGRTVKVIEVVEASTLIGLSSRGPVGFVPTAALGKLRSPEGLARELVPGCDGDAKEACAIRQRGDSACLDKCRESAPDPSFCPELCSLGLGVCQATCDRKVAPQTKAKKIEPKKPTSRKKTE